MLQNETLHTALLGAVEVVLAPFERPQPVVLHGHYYGALYMQALAQWLCAWRAGTATEALSATVQRVGRAVAGAYLRLGARRDFKIAVTERVHLEYIRMSHSPIWGAQDDDVFWNAFCTRMIHEKIRVCDRDRERREMLCFCCLGAFILVSSQVTFTLSPFFNMIIP